MYRTWICSNSSTWQIWNDNCARIGLLIAFQIFLHWFFKNLPNYLESNDWHDKFGPLPSYLMAECLRLASTIRHGQADYTDIGDVQSRSNLQMHPLDAFLPPLRIARSIHHTQTRLTSPNSSQESTFDILEIARSASLSWPRRFDARNIAAQKRSINGSGRYWLFRCCVMQCKTVCVWGLNYAPYCIGTA